MSPWLSMWTRPRNTVRVILQTNPRYGVLYLAAVYALQGLFYFANYWSVGVYVPFYYILIAGIVLCPFIGLIWLYFSAWVFHFTGKWLKGRAPTVQLRTAVAWAKIPTSINLLMWIILLLTYPHSAFILDAGAPSSMFINIIGLILGIWSLVLLIQSIREVQFFSPLRAIANVAIACFIFTIVFSVVVGIIRYFYILTI